MNEELTQEATALNAFILECASGEMHTDRVRIEENGRKVAIAGHVGGRCGTMNSKLSIKAYRLALCP